MLDAAIVNARMIADVQQAKPITTLSAARFESELTTSVVEAADASGDGRYDRVPKILASLRHVPVPGTGRQRNARSSVLPTLSCETSIAGTVADKRH